MKWHVLREFYTCNPSACGCECNKKCEIWKYLNLDACSYEDGALNLTKNNECIIKILYKSAVNKIFQ